MCFASYSRSYLLRARAQSFLIWATCMFLVSLATSVAGNLPGAPTSHFQVVDNTVVRTRSLKIDVKPLVGAGFLGEPAWIDRREGGSMLGLTLSQNGEWKQSIQPIITPGFSPTEPAPVTHCDRPRSTVYVFAKEGGQKVFTVKDGEDCLAVSPNALNNVILIALSDSRDSVHILSFDVKRNKILKNIAVERKENFGIKEITWVDQNTALAFDRGVHWTKYYLLKIGTGKVTREIPNRRLRVEGQKVIVDRH